MLARVDLLEMRFDSWVFRSVRTGFGAWHALLVELCISKSNMDYVT